MQPLIVEWFPYNREIIAFETYRPATTGNAVVITTAKRSERTIVRTLRENQPLRMLLNLLFYHFNHSEPTYKSERIKLLDVITACNQLNVNALN